MMQVRDAARELDDLEPTRRPRPCASESVLPCSAVTQRASSSRLCVDQSSRNRNITSARFSKLVLRHAGKAALAARDGSVDLLDGGQHDLAGLLSPTQD